MKRWMVLPAAAAVIALTTAQSAGAALRVGATDSPSASDSVSTTTPTGSSVLIAMGHLHDPSNTFWEVFLRPAATSSWALHTPPGVASNGGLVLASSTSGALTVGFVTSADLRFSPVAQSDDGGEKWTSGELPSPLTARPDALAVGPAGETLALVASHGDSVLQTSGDLSIWQPLTSVSALTSAAPSCGVRGVTAVAYNAAARPLLGLECSRKGEIGVLADTAPSGDGPSTWRDIGLTLGSSTSAASVTRLVSTSRGISGLARVGSGKRTSVAAFWGSGSTAQWAGPTLFPIPAGWAIKATATGGGSGQSFAVLLGLGTGRRVEMVAGPGAPWTTLPPAPRGASGVATDGAEVDAFVVTGSHLAVWAWTAGATSWTRTGSITVPVPYGSSG
jgi:hypothetical protein